jgi:hypothetical protein
MDFSALLNPKTYADAEPVEVFVAEVHVLPGSAPAEPWSTIPEPLWDRVLALGRAYRLHFAQVVGPVDDAVFEPAQCQWLCEELAFLGGVVSDPAAQEALTKLYRAAARVANAPALRLVISPP